MRITNPTEADVRRAIATGRIVPDEPIVDSMDTLAEMWHERNEGADDPDEIGDNMRVNWVERASSWVLEERT